MKKSNSRHNIIRELVTLFLAIGPILSMYEVFGLRLDFICFLLLLIITVIYSKGYKYVFPQKYMLLWGYMAFSYLFFTSGHLRPSSFIPGGVTFAGYSLFLASCTYYLDYEFFKKVYRFIFIVTLALFVGQELMYLAVGYRFVPILPLGELSTPLTYNEMVDRNMFVDRSASIFFEPAHYASFILPLLAIELFDDKHRRISVYAILAIITLLVLRSGTGLLGLTAILIYKLITVFKHMSLPKKILAFIILPISIFWVVSYYSSTEIGEEMFKRTEELTFDESGHSFSRIAMGFFIYEQLPTLNKIVGASDDQLFPIANQFVINVTDREGILFTNGWQHVLTRSGIIGLVLLILVFYCLYRGNNGQSKALIWVFLAISLVEQTFCQPLMLIVMVLANYSKNVVIVNKEQ